MTIDNDNSSWNDVGDNVVTSFFFDNLVVKDTDLDVYLDGILKTIVVDYNVTGAGTDAGSVDFMVAPGLGVAVAIIRNTEEDQQTAYPFNGPFPAISHEAALDKLTIISQENTRDLKKTLRFRQFSLIENIFVDDPVGDAILVHSADGLTIINGPSVQGLITSITGGATTRPVVIVTDDLDVSTGFTTETFFSVFPADADTQVVITIPDATTGGFVGGLEGQFKLSSEGSILLTTPTVPPETNIDGQIDQVIADLGAALTVIADVVNSEWSVSQDSRPTEGIGLTIFATTTADPIIAGYSVAVTSNDDGRYDDPAVVVTTVVITNAAIDRSTAEETSVFIADAGAVGDLLDADLVITVVTNITPSNARTVQFFSSLYVRDSGGTEVLIKETANSGIVTSLAAEQTLLFSNVTAEIDITDRLVIKTFAFKTSAGGTNPAVQFPVGGLLPSDIPARVKVPQSLTSAQSHNSLLGLQGGIPTEFYHMSQVQNDGFPGTRGSGIAVASTIVAGASKYAELTGGGTVDKITVAINRELIFKCIAATTFPNSVDIITVDGVDLIISAGGIVEFISVAADKVQVLSGGVAGGGWILVETVTLTGNASEVLGEGNIDAGFDYQIRGKQIKPSVDLTNVNALRVQIGTGGGPTYQVTGYKSLQLSGQDAAAQVAEDAQTAGFLASAFGNSGGAAAGETFDFTMEINNPATNQAHRSISLSSGADNTGQENAGIFGSSRATAEVGTGFRVLPGTGVLQTGELQLYKRANS